jgi:putative phosphoribosyl transferase
MLPRGAGFVLCGQWQAGCSSVRDVMAQWRQLRLSLGSVILDADLTAPTDAGAIVVFAHGSGSGRRSPRNRAVAEGLREAGLATLLVDLLTSGEEVVDTETARLRFDIPLLAGRVVAATDWIDRHLGEWRIGYFGASTGAAAALVAAAERPDRLAAVVSRGGRPDLAGAALPRVQAPTLLIVGSADPVVLDLNLQALTALRCEKQLEVVTGAGHLFEEPGTLDRVTVLARDWFVSHLTAPLRARRAAG